MDAQFNQEPSMAKKTTKIKDQPEQLPAKKKRRTKRGGREMRNSKANVTDLAKLATSKNHIGFTMNGQLWEFFVRHIGPDQMPAVIKAATPNVPGPITASSCTGEECPAGACPPGLP
jgi:hypothetical protein